MLTTETCVASRYPDCDRMGIVHHAVYPVWYELARMDWLEAVGFSFARSQSLGVNPAMVDLHIRYLAPVGYPQTVRITTEAAEVAPKKLRLRYTLRDESGATAGEAESFHIWTGPDLRSYNLQAGQPELYEALLAAR